MKIWVEVDGSGFVYLHTSEPEPIPYEMVWEGKKGTTIEFLVGDPLYHFFKKRIKKDTVAEFELNCIWERVEE